jgi:hypothetical protein
MQEVNNNFYMHSNLFRQSVCLGSYAISEHILYREHILNIEKTVGVPGGVARHLEHISNTLATQ